jgi:dipeptidyl aminopeptidase/acylaminoacyl peptidase
MTTATRRPLTIDDLTRLQLVSTPQLSPDGSQIAYAVATIHAGDDENEYRSAIYLVPSDGRAAPRRLTHGLKQDRSPVWSPDGQRLAFVSDRGEQALPVEFVRYPDESHNHAVGGQPKHRVDRLERILAWLKRYL